jgi:DNA-binding protein HU-beta
MRFSDRHARVIVQGEESDQMNSVSFSTWGATHISLVFSLGTREGRRFTPRRSNKQNIMAKALSKSQIAAAVAEKNGLTKKQATEIIASIVELAYKNAKNSFTLPGLGKLVLVNRKARMGRNPATGETIKIAAKRVVKFRVAKAAKDAILGAK